MSDTATDTTNREGIELKADGTMALWLDGTEYRIRRPKGREFRQLRESLQGRIDTINDEVDKANVIKAALVKAATDRGGLDSAGDPIFTPEEKAADRHEARAVNDLRERLTAEWWVEMLDVLHGPGHDLTWEDMPPWTLDPDETVILMVHWRTVPSLSGGR